MRLFNTFYRRYRAAIVLLFLLLGSGTQAQVNHLVISQVFPQGGSSGAAYNRDYVELFNPTGSSVSLSSHVLGYWSATGGSGGQLALVGSVPANGYFLIALATGASGNAVLTTGDQIAASPNLSGTAGRVVLYTGTSTTTIPAPNAANVVDFVGYGGTAATFEGTGPAGVPLLTNALIRGNGGCTDTNDNPSNFSVAAANPRNAASALNYCGPSKLTVSTLTNQTSGAPFSVIVTAQDPSDVARNVFANTTITLSTNGAAGAIGGTITGQINAGSSGVTINGVTLATAGTNATITATRNTGDALTAGTSNQFNVTAGAAIDCNGTPGGSALPGTACNDNDPCTINDLYTGTTPSCGCAGTFQDTDTDGTCDASDGCPNDINKIAAGVCGCGNPEVGSICNDGNDCTTGDQITICGTCAGSPLLDSDDDGSCDLIDECDSDPLKVLAGSCGCGTPEVGTTCSDANDNTVNDQYTACGVCSGLTPFVYWNFQTTIATTELLPHAVVDTLVRGNNFNSIGGSTSYRNATSPSSGYTGASGNNNLGAAARTGALNTGANGSVYFEFTITPALDSAVVISEFRFGSRSTSTGPQAYSIRSNRDDYATDIATGTLTNNSTWALKTSPVPAVPAIQRLARSLSGQSIKFRIYGHGGTGTASSNTANWRIDDLNVQGTTILAPVLPVVGFVAASQIAQENAGTISLGVAMDIAPLAPVTVDVSDAGTGSGVNGTDYTFSTTTLTFNPGDTYPFTQNVTVAPVNEGVFDPDYTVQLDLVVTNGDAETSTTGHTLTVLNDDLPSLVINEIDYDQPGRDNGEFIELKNTGASAIGLSGLVVDLVNSAGTNYGTVALPNISIAPGAYHVLCATNNVGGYCNQQPFASINNTNAGVRLRTAAGTLIDRMSYGTLVIATTETLPSVADPNTVGLGLSRIADGTDSNNNSLDFLISCITPGAANTHVDTDGDGTLDCLDQCPLGPEPGSACDDENSATGNDIVLANCSCAGELLDCEGTPGGPNVPGVSCVNEFHPFGDNNPNTNDDVYQNDCTCAGQVPDCLGIPGGTAVVGTVCNDFDPSTNDETYQAEPYCACAGTPCSQNVELIFRSDAHSEQIGWEILYQNDNTVVCSGGTVTTPYPTAISYIPENCCLPIGCFRLRVMDSGGDGFVSGGVTGGYMLRELNGLQRRIIDNSGNFTNLPAGPPDISALSTTYESGAFCMPMGNGKPVFQHCDKLDWANDGLVALVATEDPLVSASWSTTAPPADKGYEFWWFDPNGTYSYRRFRSHSTSDGYSPANAQRACKVKINGWTNTPTSPHLTVGKLYNVRIRSRYGVNSYSAFGQACLFKINPTAAACPLVKLQDNPANTTDFSCGVTRQFGGSNNPGINMNSSLPGSAANWGNKIVATPPQPIPAVASANVRYQFRFINDGEYPAAGSCIIRPPQTSPTIYLNWSTGDKLKCGVDYSVDVRVSLDGGVTWCVGGNTSTPSTTQNPRTYWGPVCTVSMRLNNNAPCPSNGLAGGSSSMGMENDGGDLTMYPNPNRGDQLFISLSEVAAGVNTVSVDIYDMTGKKVTARTIAVQDGYLKTVLEFGSEGRLAQGLYMVQVSAGPAIHTERLVIE